MTKSPEERVLNSELEVEEYHIPGFLAFSIEGAARRASAEFLEKQLFDVNQEEEALSRLVQMLIEGQLLDAEGKNLEIGTAELLLEVATLLDEAEEGYEHRELSKDEKQQLALLVQKQLVIENIFTAASFVDNSFRAATKHSRQMNKALTAGSYLENLATRPTLLRRKKQEAEGYNREIRTTLSEVTNDANEHLLRSIQQYVQIITRQIQGVLRLAQAL